MGEVTLVLGLLVVVVAPVTAARRLGVPYPLLLVLGGLVLAALPGLPPIVLRPELVFVLFLPPLLYHDALTNSFDELRANLPAVASLATGLVLATTALVAVVAHWATARTAVPLSWPACVVLGAIVSPTDAVAATALCRRRVAVLARDGMRAGARIPVSALTAAPPIAYWERCASSTGGAPVVRRPRP
jgi:CPA1 family monovalent cation:H+ antiporter